MRQLAEVDVRTERRDVAGRELLRLHRVAPDPCQVRNAVAGDETPAPNGQACDVAPLPSAIVNALSLGSFSVFNVTRNAVACANGLTRNSTRSAALLA